MANRTWDNVNLPSGAKTFFFSFKSELAAPTFTLLRIEYNEVSMMTMDNTNNQQFLQLNAVTSNGTGVDNSNVIWSSDDENVVTISNSGLMESVGVGQAQISCQSGDDIFYCDVWSYATMPSVTSSDTLRGGFGKSDHNDASLTGLFVLKNNPTDDIKSFSSRTVFSGNGSIGNPVCRTTAQGYTVGNSPDVGGYRFNFIYYLNSNLSRYTYEDKLLLANTWYDYDYSASSDGFVINGLPMSINNQVDIGATWDAFFYQVFRSSFKFCSYSSFDSTLLNSADIKDHTKCKYYYNNKNYIRFTDDGIDVNKVLIPNIGTAGSDYDSEPTSVDGAWFTGV